ncbi:uncharacterized membrane protein YhaH (DUF805 family) [Crossiella equi]|uniref:Uncharacterized membrane protein YhaH (DUF805 family) n=1 Tax=Crossiella equi TaxID=130796 RepID=A0ABS5ADT6_9PSEU|nr:DUF805 domain-containing protein [Crossiella equi]MBP2474758.1 uncharacterized membrane protein YhaH (DUF805 family) [Crossiella equi]
MWLWPHEAVVRVLRKSVDWTGRASRSEYWWWVLFVALAWLFTLGVTFRLTDEPPGFVLVPLVLLWVPTIAVLVRRLHDSGRSGAWWFLSLVPFGVLVLLVLLALPGTPGVNRFGPPPGTM